MSTAALLVIDAQKIYTDKDGGLYCQDATKTLDNINKLIDDFAAAGAPVVYIRHIHKADGSDLGRMFDYAGPVPDFNFKSTSTEVEFSAGLKRVPGSLEVTKTRYSCFIATALVHALRTRSISRIAICGFMTNFCCESAARDGHDLDFFVDFIADATGTPGTATMKQKQIREVVSALLSEGFAEVFTTREYLKRLPERLR